MSIISLRIADDLEARLARLVRETGRPRSDLMREALAMYLASHERQRIDSLLAAAARMTDPDAARELAEEAVQTDNEALSNAEPLRGSAVGEDPWPAKWWKA